MRKSSIILLLLIMTPSLVFADTAVLTGGQGQIATYNITLNKTSSDIGINTFALLNNNNISIGSSYQNCTVTTTISCQAIFIIQQGSWGRLVVFDNGNLYEDINLQNPINYTIPTQVPPKAYIQVGISYLPYVIGAIISCIITGNVIYYYKKKEELE